MGMKIPGEGRREWHWRREKQEMRIGKLLHTLI